MVTRLWGELTTDTDMNTNTVNRRWRQIYPELSVSAAMSCDRPSSRGVRVGHEVSYMWCRFRSQGSHDTHTNTQRAEGSSASGGVCCVCVCVLCVMLGIKRQSAGLSQRRSAANKDRQRQQLGAKAWTAVRECRNPPLCVCVCVDCIWYVGGLPDLWSQLNSAALNWHFLSDLNKTCSFYTGTCNVRLLVSVFKRDSCTFRETAVLSCRDLGNWNKACTKSYFS